MSASRSQYPWRAFQIAFLACFFGIGIGLAFLVGPSIVHGGPFLLGCLVLWSFWIAMPLIPAPAVAMPDPSEEKLDG